MTKHELNTLFDRHPRPWSFDSIDNEVRDSTGKRVIRFSFSYRDTMDALLDIINAAAPEVPSNE